MTIRCAFATCAAMILFACGSHDHVGQEGETGEVTMFVTSVPADGTCLQVTVAGASRTVARSFDLPAGQSSTVSLGGLPIGTDTFAEQAFAGACSAVTSTSVATWVSDPVAAVVSAGVVANLTIVLHRNGRASVTSDFQDDPAGGSCAGAVCAANADCCSGTSCVNAVCTAASCPAGQQLCSNSCVDTSSDVSNCGSCGSVCAAPPNGSAACANGACTTTCNAGFADCNSSPADGCEANVSNSVQNCGACGRVCSAANGTDACINGQCVLQSCTPGFQNCDGNLANGCESSINTDVQNCGGCGLVCAPPPNGGAACTNGACRVAFCLSAFRDCNGAFGDGCEINTNSDRNNCGACGAVCPLFLGCVSGHCQ